MARIFENQGRNVRKIIVRFKENS